MLEPRSAWQSSWCSVPTQRRWRSRRLPGSRARAELGARASFARGNRGDRGQSDRRGDRPGAGGPAALPSGQSDPGLRATTLHPGPGVSPQEGQTASYLNRGRLVLIPRPRWRVCRGALRLRKQRLPAFCTVATPVAGTGGPPVTPRRPDRADPGTGRPRFPTPGSWKSSISTRVQAFTPLRGCWIGGCPGATSITGGRMPRSGPPSPCRRGRTPRPGWRGPPREPTPWPFRWTGPISGSAAAPSPRSPP
jgi:hypothetical protein